MVLKNFMIKNIQLENIKTFPIFKHDFHVGYNFIEGDSGTGKTGILRSIGSGLCLASGSYLVRDGSDKGIINLLIELDGEEYLIHKELIRKDGKLSTANCYVKDKRCSRTFSATELDRYVFNLLNFRGSLGKKEIYKYAIFTVQGEMLDVLSTKKEDIQSRIQTLRKTFGMEEYKNSIYVATKIVSDIGKKKIGLDARSNDIYKHKATFEKESRELIEIQDENNKLVSQEKGYEEELKKFIQSKKSKEEEKSKYDNAEGVVIRINRDIEERKGEILDIENLIDDYQEDMKSSNSDIEYLRGKYDKNEKNIDESFEVYLKVCKEELEKLRHDKKLKEEERDKYTEAKMNVELTRKDIDNKSNQINSIKDDIVENDSDISGFDSEIVKLLEVKRPTDKSMDKLVEEEKEYEKLIIDLSTNKGKIESSIETYDTLKQRGICPTCEQEVDNNVFESKIQKRLEEFSNVDVDITKNRDIVSDIKLNIFDLRRYEDAQEKIDGYNTRRRVCIEDIENNDEEIKDLECELIKLDRDLKNYQRELYLFNNLSSDIDDINKRITNLSDDISFIGLMTQCQILKDKVRDLEKDNELCVQKSEIYNELLEEIKRIEREISDKEHELKVVYNNISKNKGVIEEKIKTVNKIRKDIENKENEIRTSKYLEEYETLLKNVFIPGAEKIEKILFKNIKNRFNKHIQQLSSSLLDNTELKVEIDEEFTPVVKIDGIKKNIERISGGEKASVAFAYRVILNMLTSELVGINLPLIFDEPTYGLSKSKLTNLRNLMKDMRYKELKDKQIIIVSHEEMFKNVADYSFKLVKIDKKTSVIEEISS